MKHINPQVEQMTPFIVMDVLERAKELEREGVSIIHLEVGNPTLIRLLVCYKRLSCRWIISAHITPILWAMCSSGKKLPGFTKMNTM